MSEKAHDAHAGAPEHPPHVAATGAVRPGRPTDAELDEREWNKVGPRRPAGPPLAGGAPGPGAESIRPHEPPPTTDPKEQ
jgi:hypothetical protein